MGFLIAMVAPRLAGISGGAVDTVCDSNQNRMVTYMSSFFEKTNRFPNKLTNIVEINAAREYQIPAISDDDPDNGPETLASEFNDRNRFGINILSSDEAKALKAMGIVKVFNLNSYPDHNTDDYTEVPEGDRSPFMDPVDVEEGVGVAMVGLSCDAAGAFALTSTKERGWGEPDWFGRMVLGMGPESSLITSGIISNAAHCPGGIQNTDNCTYNDYNLVLPRLQATVDKFDGDTVIAGIDSDTTKDGIQITAVAYDDEPADDYDVNANDDKLRVRTFTIEAQETWQFATQCPEGHMYPEDDGEFWGIPGLSGDALLAAD
jgi:hypothetical protein